MEEENETMSEADEPNSKALEEMTVDDICDFYENNLHIGEWTEYTVNEDADDGLKDMTSEEMLRICEKELNYSTVMCDDKLGDNECNEGNLHEVVNEDIENTDLNKKHQKKSQKEKFQTVITK